MKASLALSAVLFSLGAAHAAESIDVVVRDIVGCPLKETYCDLMWKERSLLTTKASINPVETGAFLAKSAAIAADRTGSACGVKRSADILGPIVRTETQYFVLAGNVEAKSCHIKLLGDVN